MTVHPQMVMKARNRTNDSLISHYLHWLRGSDPGLRLQAMAKLSRVAEDHSMVVPAFCDALLDDFMPVKQLAAIALAHMGHPPRITLPFLVRALEETNENLLIRVLMALKEMGPEARQAVPKLVALFPHAKLALRRCIIWTLGCIGPAASPAIPLLIDTLNEEDIRIRVMASVALFRMGSRAIPALVQTLSSPHPGQLQLTIRILGKMGPPRDALVPLQQLRQHPDPAIRDAVQEALAEPYQTKEMSTSATL